MGVEIDGGGGGKRHTLLLGCLISVGVVFVLLAAGGWYAWSHARGWAADGIESAMKQLAANADLGDEERAQVETELQRFVEAFRRGDVTFAELGQVAQAVSKSPLIPAAVLYGARTQYLQPSGLSDEEKTAGSLELSRLARGVYEGSIEPSLLAKVFGPISTTTGSGRGVHVSTPNFQLHLRPPEDVTDEELREVIKLATQEADQAGVPDEPFTIDASDEIHKAMTQALGRELPAADDEP